MMPITHFEVDPSQFDWVSRSRRERQTSILFMPWQHTKQKGLKICIEMNNITHDLYEIDDHWLISHHISIITQPVIKPP